MCGRYAIYTLKDLRRRFKLQAELFPCAPRYNVAPSQPTLAIRQEVTGRKAILLQWGLVPHWAKDPAMGKGLILARAETVASKPSYRDAFRYRRCLIPVDGFYEWQKQGAKKQPYYFHRHDGQPFALAGLWEHWQDAHGNELETCAFITTDPNAVVKPIHDRMPVILDPEHYDEWLAPDTPLPRLQELLKPYSDDLLIVHPVNLKGGDNPQCITPVLRENPPQGDLFDLV